MLIISSLKPNAFKQSLIKLKDLMYKAGYSLTLEHTFPIFNFAVKRADGLPITGKIRKINFPLIWPDGKPLDADGLAKHYLELLKKDEKK